MSFNSTFGAFAYSNYSGLTDGSEYGAPKRRPATAGKRRKIGPLRAWKKKNGIKRGVKAKSATATMTKDSKGCHVVLVFANPKGGADLVFKHLCKAPHFRPFAKLCKKAKPGATYKGTAGDAAAADTEAEATESDAVESGEVEAAGEESDDGGEMAGFGALWQPPQYRTNPGMFGAASTRSARPSSRRPLRYSRDQAIAKFPRFRDEDARLKVAFATGNTKLATKTFARVARLRDHFYKKAALAAQGKATGQVVGRVYLGIATGGLTELLRLSGALKGKVGKDRAKRAEHFLALGDACEAIFRFWKSKFGESHRSGDKTFPALDIAKIRSLAIAGKSHEMPVGEGEDVESDATGISEEVATNISSQIQARGQPEFQPMRPGPSSMRQGPGRGGPQAPRNPRSKMYIGEEIQSGVPGSQPEFSWAGVGAIALGALGGLLVAPRIGL
jgi:hypothetical protein